MNKLSLITNKIYKFFRKAFLLVGLSFLLLFIFTTLVTILNSKDKIFTEVTHFNGKNNVLVLGTSKYSASGKTNHFYENRIQSAIKLYRAGKVRKFILSGHIDEHYNEPRQMEEDLTSSGIPKSIIIKDGRGDRTVDSILNLKKIYNITDRIIIISQTFHIQRALLLANIYGIEALGFSAASPPLEDGLKTYLREVLARIILLRDIIYY